MPSASAPLLGFLGSAVAIDICKDRCLECIDIIEGSLEVKLPTIWTDEKQSRAEAEEEND